MLDYPDLAHPQAASARAVTTPPSHRARAGAAKRGKRHRRPTGPGACPPALARMRPPMARWAPRTTSRSQRAARCACSFARPPALHVACRDAPRRLAASNPLASGPALSHLVSSCLASSRQRPRPAGLTRLRPRPRPRRHRHRRRCGRQRLPPPRPGRSHGKRGNADSPADASSSTRLRAPAQTPFQRRHDGWRRNPSPGRPPLRTTILREGGTISTSGMQLVASHVGPPPCHQPRTMQTTSSLRPFSGTHPPPPN